MNGVKWRWLMVIALATGAGSALVLQWQTGAELRLQLQPLREQNRELARLREENRRRLETQGPPGKLEDMRTDHAALVRLRGELEMLKQQAEEKARAPIAKNVAGAEAQGTMPSVTDEMVPVGRLKNAGRSTPVATLETALWAAVGGDTDALAKTFLIEPPLRGQIEAVIARLPEVEREKYDTPERFLALMTAQDVPLGEAHIIEPKQEISGSTFLAAQMRSSEGKPTMAVFSLRREGDDWRLVVPAQAVEKYLARLKGSAPPAGR